MSIHKVTYHSKEKYLLLGVSLREYLRCPMVFAQGRWRLGICMPAERQRGERPSASTSALETYEREMADRGTSRCGARIYQ